MTRSWPLCERQVGIFIEPYYAYHRAAALLPILFQIEKSLFLAIWRLWAGAFPTMPSTTKPTCLTHRPAWETVRSALCSARPPDKNPDRPVVHFLLLLKICLGLSEVIRARGRRRTLFCNPKRHCFHCSARHLSTSIDPIRPEKSRQVPINQKSY